MGSLKNCKLIFKRTITCLSTIRVCQNSCGRKELKGSEDHYRFKTFISFPRKEWISNSVCFLQTSIPEREHDRKNNVSSMFALRSHTCGELSLKHVNEKVKLCGWVQYQRMGQFLTLRDRYGVTQIIVPKMRKDLKEVVQHLSLESVVAIEGIVVSRPKGQENFKMATGVIEVHMEKLIVLNTANPQLPFSIREYNKAKETLQMKYRYLALRFPHLQRNLCLRSKLLMRMREYLCYTGNFLEIETPTLFRRTPGGAQEFVVPTREPGAFYALTQSPQQLKQLLMAGGMDRYFQVARCYRDEGSRPDRQPEFTQLDIEMSFVDVDSVISLVENLLKYSWPEELGTLTIPFPKITFEEAIRRYGTDKPDTRYPFEIQDITHIVLNNPGIFAKMLGKDFFAGCLAFSSDSISKSTIVKYKEEADKNFPSVKFILLKECTTSTLVNILGTKGSAEFLDTFKFSNQAIFLAVGPYDDAHALLGRLRVQHCRLLKERGMLSPEENFHFLWVHEFPLFAPGKEPGSLESLHHPFTQPHPDDASFLKSNPCRVRGLHYDLVLNGCEVGGGSIRIHDAALQADVLKMLALEADGLGHLLEALRSGCPPHGGIALGVDRLVSIICGAESIREVIAFPKGFDGKDPMSGAPAPISLDEMKLYHIKSTDC